MYVHALCSITTFKIPNKDKQKARKYLDLLKG